jgi:hypothetical protein
LLSGAIEAEIGSTAASAIASAAGGFCASAVSGAITSQKPGAILRDGLVSAVTAGISSGVLHDYEGNLAVHTLGHAVLGGAAQAAEGGKFWSGFASSGLTSGIGDSWIGGISSSPLVRTMIAAGLGGGISRLTGGSFYNGAMNSGLEWAYNSERGNWGSYVAHAFCYDPCTNEDYYYHSSPPQQTVYVFSTAAHGGDFDTLREEFWGWLLYDYNVVPVGQLDGFVPPSGSYVITHGAFYDSAHYSGMVMVPYCWNSKFLAFSGPTAIIPEGEFTSFYGANHVVFCGKNGVLEYNGIEALNEINKGMSNK